MLNRKSQRLDLQESWLADQTIEIDTQGMCSEFGVEASAQAPERMRMIDFNLELDDEDGLAEIFGDVIYLLYSYCITVLF